MKKCTYCGNTKPLLEFYHRKGKPRSECKDCTKSVNKRTVTKEAKLRGQRSYRERNRDKLNEKSKQYKKLNRHICNAQWTKYYTKKKQACPDWLTEEQHEEIRAVYEHARECEMLTGDKYHVDHIIPINGKNVSGLHVPWNLQVLPADINIVKSNKLET